MIKQMSLDAWKINHLTQLLEKFSSITIKTGRPIILFRQTLEESDNCYEEIICSLTDRHVIEQIVTSGGMLVPSFQQQAVFTIKEYPQELLKKSHDRFAEVSEFLEEQKNITVNKDQKTTH